MNTSDLIHVRHTSRRAVVYVRQSSSNQVINNQECRHLQYALRERALQLGWHEQDVEVIDIDLGPTAATTDGRVGFQELVAQVALSSSRNPDRLRCHTAGPQLFALVSAARSLWPDRLFDCRPRRSLRLQLDQRPIVVGIKGSDFGAGIAHDPGAIDRRHSQQGRARRIGVDVAERGINSILNFDTSLNGSICVSAADIKAVTGVDPILAAGIAFEPARQTGENWVFNWPRRRALWTRFPSQNLFVTAEGHCTWSQVLIGLPDLGLIVGTIQCPAAPVFRLGIGLLTFGHLNGSIIQFA